MFPCHVARVQADGRGAKHHVTVTAEIPALEGLGFVICSNLCVASQKCAGGKAYKVIQTHCLKRSMKGDESKEMFIDSGEGGRSHLVALRVRLAPDPEHPGTRPLLQEST